MSQCRPSRVGSSTARRRPGVQGHGRGEGDGGEKGGRERGMRRTEVTGADELLSATQGRRVSLCRAAATTATVSSSWSLVVGDGKRCILSCALFFAFFRQMVQGETRVRRWNGDWGGRGWGAHQRFLKRTPTVTHNLLTRRHVES